MKASLKFLILFAVTSLLIPCFTASAQTEGVTTIKIDGPKLSATIINFGEISEDENRTSIPSQDSHNDSLFVMEANTVPQFYPSEDNSKITIKIGTQFGILVQLDGTEDGSIIPVKTRWTHPKFNDGVKIEEWPSPMNVGYGRYAGWVIESEDEMVAGNWTVEILFKGKVIASKTFQITPSLDGHIHLKK